MTKKNAFLFIIPVLVILVLVLLAYQKTTRAPDQASVPAKAGTPGGVHVPVQLVRGEPVQNESGPSQPVQQQLGQQEHQHDGDSAKPSAETIEAIRELKKPVEGEGQVTEYPDGSASIKLGNRFRSVPVATIGEDGKVHVDYHGEKYLQDQTTTEANNP